MEPRLPVGTYIDQLEMPARPKGALNWYVEFDLKRGRKATIRDVLELSERDAFRIPDFGRVSARDLQAGMAAAGYEWPVRGHQGYDRLMVASDIGIGLAGQRLMLADDIGVA